MYVKHRLNFLAVVVCLRVIFSERNTVISQPPGRYGPPKLYAYSLVGPESGEQVLYDALLSPHLLHESEKCIP